MEELKISIQDYNELVNHDEKKIIFFPNNNDILEEPTTTLQMVMDNNNNTANGNNFQNELFVDDLVSDPDTVERLLIEMGKNEPNKKAVFLVIGPSGHGKSKTLNTLFGMKYFKTSADNSSTTIKPVIVPHPCNHNLRFIDTPGMFDVRGRAIDEQNVQDVINFCSSQNPENTPNCIIMVMKFSSPFDGVMMKAVDLVHHCKLLWGCTVVVVFTFSTNQQIQMPDDIFEDFREYVSSGDNRRLARWKASRDYHEKIASQLFDTDLVFFIDNDEFLEDYVLPDGTHFLTKFIQEGILPINISIVGSAMRRFSNIEEVKLEAERGMSNYLKKVLVGSLGSGAMAMVCGVASAGLPISQAVHAPMLLQIGLAPTETIGSSVIFGSTMATCGIALVGGTLLYGSKKVYDSMMINSHQQYDEKHQNGGEDLMGKLLFHEIEKRTM